MILYFIYLFWNETKSEANQESPIGGGLKLAKVAGNLTSCQQCKRLNVEIGLRETYCGFTASFWKPLGCILLNLITSTIVTKIWYIFRLLKTCYNLVKEINVIVHGLFSISFLGDNEQSLWNWVLNTGHAHQGHILVFLTAEVQIFVLRCHALKKCVAPVIVRRKLWIFCWTRLKTTFIRILNYLHQ